MHMLGRESKPTLAREAKERGWEDQNTMAECRCVFLSPVDSTNS